MIREHNIKWFLEEPTRLMLMKPFTRGGHANTHGYEYMEMLNNSVLQTGFCNLTLTPISQDTYITEYRPDLHTIINNGAFQHVKVVMDGVEIPPSKIEMVQTASFQKLIHSAHTRNLTVNNLEFTLCNEDPEDGERKIFGEIKQEWTWREREYDKYMAINNCKQLGNCATLFWFDKETGQYGVSNYNYEDGYQVTSNYDEYGIEVARSLFYQVDNKIVIDTYDNKYHYHITQADKGWNIQHEIHGFSRNPLLTKRGKVAWEYAQSTIDFWELLTNINIIALKRFGTFALAFWGEMDRDTFQRDSSTLVISMSSDTTNGKQDAKILEFPEPKTMDGFLKTLEEKISLFSSTSFITPKDITSTNSGGNGIALAMSNDYALATQGKMDWNHYMNQMVYLHQEGMDLERGGSAYYSKVRIGAKIVPWSLETNNTKILNLVQEGTYLSTQTLLEKMPDSAPDEIDRVLKERGKLVARDGVTTEEEGEKAGNIARNNSNEIVDNVKKQDKV